jgi:hypothetical protein
MDEKEDFIFKCFGYRQHKEDERDKWVIYNNFLIVINPECKPKIYKYGCQGQYYEIDPI